METPREFSPFDPARKKGFRNLTERLVHDVVSYAFVGWTAVFLSVMKFFIVGERFTQRSS